MTTREVSDWAVGWTWFAAVMLWIVGALSAIQGLVAIINESFYVVTPEYIFQFDVTTWGWIHLIIGVVMFLAGIGLLSSAMWARVVAVIAASLSLVANFAWLPWYPFWSSILIAVDIAVIWAVTVHGRDISISRDA
ncbi:MAG: DUF7144 family membrane protein [Acidimicrobiia bacterium]